MLFLGAKPAHLQCFLSGIFRFLDNAHRHRSGIILKSAGISHIKREPIFFRNVNYCGNEENKNCETSSHLAIRHYIALPVQPSF